ncbi:hypothetical protein ACIOHE_16420 [Streptomyces sp. NPDC087851]|uniref:hypothetical protein n=1 Tax=Streptomyces sp. NPDC087851 TaxID=3365810 RepID=UPI003803D14C
MVTARDDVDPFTAMEALRAALAVALRPDDEDLHAECRQAEDVLPPWVTGLLPARRCTCPCHGNNHQGSTQDAGQPGHA